MKRLLEKKNTKFLLIGLVIITFSITAGVCIYQIANREINKRSENSGNPESNIFTPTDTLTVDIDEGTNPSTIEKEKLCSIGHQYYYFKELNLSFCYPQSFSLEELPDGLKIKNQNIEYPPYSITISNKLDVYENASRQSSRDKYFKIGGEEYMGKAYSFGDGGNWGYSGGTTWWIEISKDLIMSIYQSESYSIDLETGIKTTTSATDENISAGEEILESVHLNLGIN